MAGQRERGRRLRCLHAAAGRARARRRTADPRHDDDHERGLRRPGRHRHGDPQRPRLRRGQQRLAGRLRRRRAAPITIVSGPTPASANVPNGGAGVNYVWTVRLDEAAEYRFSAGAEDAAATTSWPPATSASVLAATGGPGVVTWDLGSNVPGVPGEFIDSGRFPGVFAFRGANTTEFSRYASNTASWSAMAPADERHREGRLADHGRRRDDLAPAGQLAAGSTGTTSRPTPGRGSPTPRTTSATAARSST